MKLAARIAVPLVAVAALTGCAHSPSTAAIVGDKVISEAEVTEIVDSCKATGIKSNRLGIVSLMVFGEIFEGAAQRLGESFDDAALQVMKRDPQLAPLVGTPCAKPFKNGFRMEIGKKVLDPGSVKASLPSVEINPRYGAWDPEKGIDPRGGAWDPEKAFDPMGGSMSVEVES